MREPMESRKEQKRQSLLDAAYALFTEKGVAKTSVDEIVRERGQGHVLSVFSR